MTPAHRPGDPTPIADQQRRDDADDDAHRVGPNGERDPGARRLCGAGEIGQGLSSSRAHPLSHSLRKFRRQGAHCVDAAVQRGHQRRAHDHAVSIGPDLGSLFARPHAQAHPDRNVGDRPDPCDEFGAALDTAAQAPVTPMVEAA